ncbi:hypothetical protein TNCV_4687911 [Trichonephila clavipes]|nr:hypothetical protein TNCV_4687911 [Trichonephila clavipes]
MVKDARSRCLESGSIPRLFLDFLFNQMIEIKAAFPLFGPAHPKMEILPSFKGCDSPAVKVSDHGKHVMSSSPVPPKTHHVGQR